MKPSTALRAASVFTALLFAGHTAGMPWTPVKTEQSDALVRQMQAYRFDIMGFTRGYWDFYFGFGVAISVCLAAFSVLMWQVARLARDSPATARPLIATLFVAFVANTVVDVIYFFTPPIALSALITVFLAIGWYTARP